MSSLAAADPAVREFTTTVESVDGNTVVLEQSYFYPEGGGQPADRGTIAETAVRNVQRRNGDVVHELATRPSFQPGERVDVAVDDQYRTYCMRAHTASHLLYGAGRRLLDDLGYGGFNIDATPADETSAEGKPAEPEPADVVPGKAIEGKVRVDFATSTEIDDPTLVELERLTNRAVWNSYDVTWEQVPREEALSRDEVAFNTATAEGVEGDTVRIVTIGDWDVAACGGTHVANTRQVGPVTVLDRSNPGEGLTRVEFTVGVPAIRQRAVTHAQARDAATALDTRVEDLPDAVSRLQSEREELREEVENLRADLNAARLAELRDETVDKNGADWLVGTVAGLDANGLADRAQEAAGDGADVVALLSEDGQYLAVATDGAVDAGDVVDDVTAEFGGGGGGSPTVAQGGGLDTDPKVVQEYLRE